MYQFIRDVYGDPLLNTDEDRLQHGEIVPPFLKPSLIVLKLSKAHTQQ